MFCICGAMEGVFPFRPYVIFAMLAKITESCLMPTTALIDFLKTKGTILPSPIAVIFAEDDVELVGTITHHQTIGFRSILVIGDVAELEINNVYAFEAQLNCLEDSLLFLNEITKYSQGKWIYYGFNAEYLYFPFCDTRSILDAITFMEEERREAVFTYTIDLYPHDLEAHPNGIDIETAHMDRNGYYGMERFEGPDKIERQPEIFGGLRWRFEEHVPWVKRRIDRISMFKASKGLEIGVDLRLNAPEMNTVSCEWHNNMTMAVMSFRVAKSLMYNPGSADTIDTFAWGSSVKFHWSSKQLLELGFMETGQWF